MSIKDALQLQWISVIQFFKWLLLTILFSRVVRKEKLVSIFMYYFLIRMFPTKIER